MVEYLIEKATIMEWGTSTVGWIVFAVFSSSITGYTLLRYEPKDKDRVVFITAIFAFIAVSLLLSDDFATLLFNGVASLGALRTVGVVIWWLSMLGFVLSSGRRYLS